MWVASIINTQPRNKEYLDMKITNITFLQLGDST
jgi:hypothetical protein